MPSLTYEIDDLSQVGSDFIEDVNDELKRALAFEKSERRVTQQSIADTLGVDRSVVNRRFMGLENLTARTIAETLWAIGWEPHFEARKIAAKYGENEPVRNDAWPDHLRKIDTANKTVNFMSPVRPVIRTSST